MNMARKLANTAYIDDIAIGSAAGSIRLEGLDVSSFWS